jgi:phospholipase/carboxylesterase
VTGVTSRRLDRLVHPPAAGGKPRSLVVALHGLGSCGADLADLGACWGPVLPHTEFVTPDAPEPNDLAPKGLQWFSTQDRSLRGMMQGVATSAPVIDGFLDDVLAERGLDETRTALVGFSQGAMIALHVGLRRPKTPAAVVGFSGMMLAGPEIFAQIRARPPVLLVHGDDDDFVPVAALEATMTVLRAVGVTVEVDRRPGVGHRVDAGGLERCAAFLTAALNRD